MDDEAERDAKRMADIVYRLPEAEREVLLTIAHRLHSGLRRYGPLSADDDRDWRAETVEELVDAIAYLTIDLMRRGRK